MIFSLYIYFRFDGIDLRVFETSFLITEAVLLQKVSITAEHSSIPPNDKISSRRPHVCVRRFPLSSLNHSKHDWVKFGSVEEA